MWIHKKVIKPLCQPPAALKGQLSYLETKYANLSFVYGIFYNAIPAVIIQQLLGAPILLDRIVATAVFIVLSLFMVWKQAAKTLYYYQLVVAFLTFALFASESHLMDAYFAPFIGLIVLLNAGASKKVLAFYFSFSFLSSWLHSQKLLEQFAATSSKEELLVAVRTSFQNMLGSYFSMF